MALENPITSDDLTIDFASLLDLSVSDRVQAAASDTGFAQALINSLTPIQLAKAFPDYYRKELPDISNFILANRYLDDVGKGGFDQQGGGDYGDNKPLYDGETATPAGQNPIGVPEPTIEEMQAKLLEKGIDVNKTYDAIANGLSADDPQIQFLKNMSADKLAAMGIEQFKDDTGKSMYRVKPVAAESMSDDDIVKAMAESSGKVVPGNIRSDDERASYYDRMYNSVYKAAVEKGVPNPEVIARLGAAQTSIETGYGKHMVGNNAFGVKAKNDGTGIEATTQEVINGKLVTIRDKFRQYASPEESAADYVAFLQENKRYQGVLASANIQDAINAQGQTGYATDPNYADKLHSINNLMSKGASSATVNKDISEVLANATPEDIKKFREDLKSTQKKAQFDSYIKNVYNQAAPTSLDAIVDPEGKTVVENQDEIAGVRKQPITPELKEVLQYAGEESGVVVEVFSGGQNDITQGGPRKGTERHDLGHAADVKLKVKGPDGKMRTLDSRNPEDRAIMSKFVETARMMGAKGIGSGLGYMGESGIHVGTVMRPDLDYSNKEYGAPAGKEAVWLSDKWTQEAFSRGQQAAVDFEKAGGMVGYRERREEKIAEQQKKESDKTVAAKQQEEIVQITEKSGVELLPESHPFSMTPEKKKRIIEAQNAKTETTTPESTPSSVETPVAETPEVIYDGRRELFQTPEAAISPTQTAEAAPTPVGPVGGPEEAPKFRTGGSPDVQDDENLSVFDEDGSLKWKMNSGEGIYVKPKDTEYADDKMDELSGRVDDIDQKTNTPEQNQPKAAPDKATPRPERNWQQNASAVTYSIGSQGRAFKRTKFQNEGFHFSRSSPNSTSS